jgi:hypothetical protein
MVRFLRRLLILLQNARFYTTLPEAAFQRLKSYFLVRSLSRSVEGAFDDFYWQALSYMVTLEVALSLSRLLDWRWLSHQVSL